MDWTQTGVILSGIALLAGIMILFFNKVDSDINRLGNRMEGHAQRIDQLYQVILNMMKERK